MATGWIWISQLTVSNRSCLKEDTKNIAKVRHTFQLFRPREVVAWRAFLGWLRPSQPRRFFLVRHNNPQYSQYLVSLGLRTYKTQAAYLPKLSHFRYTSSTASENVRRQG